MSGRRRLLPGLALLFCTAPLQAQEASLPTPRAVIYPGDILTEAMLDDRTMNPEDIGASSVRSRAALIGKVARRTLLPGQPIPAAAVEQPRLVSVGAQVRIIYSEGGLHIAAFGLAQQAGGAGDLVRVRNLDSGLFVVGRVQNDGSIRVGEG
jgi:flagellar basal body P-ring formation protein FlgA